MSAGDYSPPLDKLLAIGKPTEWEDWPNYVEKFQLGSEHVAELIRMATDRELKETNKKQPKSWAPVYARRALGQLRAEAAIEPLISLLRECEDDDWIGMEMPPVFLLIGPPAIPALAAYWADTSCEMLPRFYAAESLSRIGQTYPDARAECVAAIASQLELFKDNQPELNSFMINWLIALKAVECAPLIERAFAADCVEESIGGDWEDAQVELGLKAERETPSKQRSPEVMVKSLEAMNRRRQVTRKAKAKSKIVKASRRKNRKHK